MCSSLITPRELGRRFRPGVTSLRIAASKYPRMSCKSHRLPNSRMRFLSLSSTFIMVESLFRCLLFLAASCIFATFATNGSKSLCLGEPPGTSPLRAAINPRKVYVSCARVFVPWYSNLTMRYPSETIPKTKLYMTHPRSTGRPKATISTATCRCSGHMSPATSISSKSSKQSSPKVPANMDVDTVLMLCPAVLNLSSRAPNSK
mmetsp:Transcript_21157/g.40270  ORF Transcript_21157/g.40270 Transcript_21157/m.40270 type:complete len:204 (-) Transcript_21157:1379-1990(-)